MVEGDPHLPPPRRAWATWRKFLLAIFLIVGLSAGATATAGLLQVKTIIGNLAPPKGVGSIGSKEISQVPAGAPQTLMIIGSDLRFGDKGIHDRHSDTILLVRLNSHAHAVAMMSIPRDLKVDVPGHGIDKINSAYAVGGASLTAEVVKSLLSTPEQPFHINHIIDINFSLFQRLVNKLGRVYVDVDRDYYHQNTATFGGYSSIDIQPGYQLLSGSQALAYVRYRHTDTDIVRAARQQSFLEDAKAQYGTSLLFNHRDELTKLIGKYTRSDHLVKTETGFIKLLDLMINLAGDPTVKVDFPAILGGPTDPFVTSDPAAVQKAVTRFLDVSGAHAAKKKAKTSRHHHKAVPISQTPGMIAAHDAGQAQGIALGSNVGLPVYYPKYVPSQATYMGPLDPPQVYPRKYSIQGPDHHRYGSYAMVLDSNLQDGNYVTVQGTTWKNAPILKGPDATRTLNHRHLDLYYDGNRIQLVAWHTPRGVYWISNTLQELVPGPQMLAMAASLTRIGS